MRRRQSISMLRLQKVARRSELQPNWYVKDAPLGFNRRILYLHSDPILKASWQLVYLYILFALRKNIEDDTLYIVNSDRFRVQLHFHSNL